MNNVATDKRVNEKEAAELLGITQKCLQKWRFENKNLSYYKVGRRVFYSTKDIQDFLEGSKIHVR